MKTLKFTVVAAVFLALILAALPSASAGPTVETPISDISFDEDEDAVGVVNLNDHFSNDGIEMDYSSIMVDSKFEVTIHDDGLVDVSTPADWYGSEVVTFIASDGEQEARETVLVTVHPVNDAPYMTIPLPNQISFKEDGKLSNAFNLYNHFSDVDSTLKFNSDSESIKVDISPEGYVDFMAPQNWHGTEDVSLSAFDGILEVFDTVTVIVTPVNDKPGSIANPGTISLDDETPTKILNLNEYFTDADGEALDYSFSGSKEIQCKINSQSGELMFSAPEGFHGEEIITVKATDSQGASSSIQVVVVGSGGESSSGLMFYSLGLVLALAVAAVRLSTVREQGPPKSPVKLGDYRHFKGY